MVAANRDFAQRNPIAAKRALRAILKAADICAAEPERAARFLAEKLYETRYSIGLEVMKGSMYTRWREANPERMRVLVGRWRSAHPEKAGEYTRRCRERRALEERP
jgi:plasmid stabilization system protein ParE